MARSSVILFILIDSIILFGCNFIAVKSNAEIIRINQQDCNQIHNYQSDYLRNLLKQITPTALLDDIFYKELLYMFGLNECESSNLLFSKEGDVSLFYSKIQILEKRSKSEVKPLRFLI